MAFCVGGAVRLRNVPAYLAQVKHRYYSLRERFSQTLEIGHEVPFLGARRTAALTPARAHRSKPCLWE